VGNDDVLGTKMGEGEGLSGNGPSDESEFEEDPSVGGSIAETEG